MTSSGNVASMRDGTKIAYTLHGDGRAPVRIALVHSLAMDRHFWDPVVKALTDKASVLTYDCRGHGESDKPAGPYRIEQFADDLSDLMDHIGWTSAVVAGASMGGCVTLAFAAGHPQKAQALGLIDTTAWYGADAPKQWAERGEKGRSEGLASLVGFQTTRWFSDAFRQQQPEVVKACVDVFVRNDPEAYVATCHMLGAADIRLALPHITVPVAILVGEEDYATPVAMAEAMHTAMPQSTLTVLEKGRHLTPLEQPERIAAALSKLAAQVK